MALNFWSIAFTSISFYCLYRSIKSKERTPCNDVNRIHDPDCIAKLGRIRRTEEIQHYLLQQFGLLENETNYKVTANRAQIDTIINREFKKSDVVVKQRKVLRKKYLFPKITIIKQDSSADAEMLKGEKLVFKVSAMPNYELARASLRLQILRPARSNEVLHKVKIAVHEYTSDTEINIDPVVQEQKQVRLPTAEGGRGKGTFVDVNITDLVTKWMKNPTVNKGLWVSATHNEQRVLGKADEEPMFVDLMVRQLKPDMVEDQYQVECTTDNMNYRNCCRYKYEVNFESFGWDWILAPKRYQAYYCAGECPLSHRSKNNYAHFLAALKEIDPESDKEIGICCAPHTLNSIKMLIQTPQGQVVEKTVQDMQVESCACA